MTSQTGGKPADPHEEFILEQEDVEIYKKSKRLARLANIPTGFISALAIFSTILLLTSIISRPLLNIINIVLPVDIPNAAPLDTDIVFVLSAIALGGLIMYVGSHILRRKFLTNARKTGVHQQNFRIHILSEGISSFRRDDYGQAISRLEKFYDLNRHHVPRFWDRIIETYIQNLRNEEDDEYVTDTYEDFAHILMEELLDTDNRREEILECIIARDPNEFTINTERRSTENKSSVTYLDIVRDSFSDYDLSRYKPQFWLIYGVAAIIGLSVFYFVNNTLGLLIVAMLAPALQVYGKRDRKEGENG